MNNETRQVRLFRGLPRLFAELISDSTDSWLQLVGQQVEHMQYGAGIVRSVSRRRSSLLIEIEFEGRLEQCPPVSFCTGIYAAMTMPPFLARVDGVSELYRRLPSSLADDASSPERAELTTAPAGEGLVAEVTLAWKRLRDKQTREVEQIVGEDRRIEEERRESEDRKRLRPILKEKLELQFQRDFLGAEVFYQTECTGGITQAEYETAKGSFVKEWMAANLPSDHSPDLSQAAAVGAVNGNVQVVARAGSGKTFSLVARSLFLQRHCRVPAEQMLLLAFNRDAAREIGARIREAGAESVPHVLTFHALAHSLIHPQEELLVDDPLGANELSQTVQLIIDDAREDPGYQGRIRAVMMRYFAEDWEAIVRGGYDRTGNDLLDFRRSLVREGIDGRHYKSQGEKVIADFLFEHGVRFEYERVRQWKDRNYRPDFTIFKGQKGATTNVVIEYFGLQGEPEYDRQIEEKRAYWEGQMDSQLLELLPADLQAMRQTDFAAAMAERLSVYGVRCTRLSDEEIWSRIQRRAIDCFTKAVVQIVGALGSFYFRRKTWPIVSSSTSAV